MALMPLLYGCGKAIGELLVSEYSRKGLRRRADRAPAHDLRAPGAPNSAASSFVSGIIREPVAGAGVGMPVPLDTRLWISSPGAWRSRTWSARAASRRRSGHQPRHGPAGHHRDPGEMLDSLERLVGVEAAPAWP